MWCSISPALADKCAKLCSMRNILCMSQYCTYSAILLGILRNIAPIAQYYKCFTILHLWRNVASATKCCVCCTILVQPLTCEVCDHKQICSQYECKTCCAILHLLRNIAPPGSYCAAGTILRL